MCIQTLTITRKPAKGQSSSLKLIRQNRSLAAFSSFHHFIISSIHSFNASNALTVGRVFAYIFVRSTSSKFHTLNKCKISQHKRANGIQKLPTHYKISFINKIELLNGQSNGNSNNNNNSNGASGSSRGCNSKVDIPNHEIGLIFNTWDYVLN